MGDIKVIVNMIKCNDGIYREICNNVILDMMELGFIFKIVFILVVLDDGVIILEMVVEIGNGVYMMYGCYMKDYNWYCGGYGIINIIKLLMVFLNIGVLWLIDDYYYDNLEKFVCGLYWVGIVILLDFDIFGVGKLNICIFNKDLSNWLCIVLVWMFIGYEI